AVGKRSSWSGLIIGSTTLPCAAAYSISPGLWPAAPNGFQENSRSGRVESKIGLTRIEQDCINGETLSSLYRRFRERQSFGQPGLGVQQRICVGGASRQNLRPHFRRDRRHISGG